MYKGKMVARLAGAPSDADVAIALVGYDAGWESEDDDRAHMGLPGDRDELVRAADMLLGDLDPSGGLHAALPRRLENCLACWY